MNLKEMDSRQKGLWEVEQEYWGLFFNGDPACLDMVSDNFLGWPHNAPAPVSKSGLKTILKKNRGQSLTAVLIPIGIHMEDRVAVVHLIRKFADDLLEDSAPSSSIRVLHTWVKNKEKWQLIGGMGYPEPVG